MRSDLKIGIHQRAGSFSDRWIAYCSEQGIPFKLVNCHESDIVAQLADCDALMWHHFHESARDIQLAKQLLFALEASGKVVFPDFPSGWHFDDKVGQKYLFETVHAPLVPAHVFYSREEALAWAGTTTFPKVFKLRGGSASHNVKLARTRKQARRFIYRAFGRGFSQYKALDSIKERWRLYRLGRTDLYDVCKGVARLVMPTPYARALHRERGYVYFQDFIPGNTHDIRVTYIYDRLIAFRRQVRPGDFRASGSYMLDPDQTMVPLEALEISLEVCRKLGFQTAALDFVLMDDKPMIVEVCYAWGVWEKLFTFGYWDGDLNYHDEAYDAHDWMVDGVIEQVQTRKK